MKYKVGDRVRTKSLDWYDKHALIDTSGVFRTSIESLCLNKKRFMGKELTISSVLSNRHYLMEETGALRWTDEMIEGLVEEEMPLDKAGQITDFEYDGLAYTLPEGYIFKDENNDVINATKIVLEKKKKEYPKTYEECAKIMNCPIADPVKGCELYKNEGCSHVDGLLCDYPKCEMLKEYRKNGNTNKEI